MIEKEQEGRVAPERIKLMLLVGSCEWVNSMHAMTEINCFVLNSCTKQFTLIMLLFNIFRTRILRHMASELKLNIRSDGYVNVNDLLNLNLNTFANIPLRSHTIDDFREVS
jgi:hypothetical protein